MSRLRFLTAGESHGPCQVAILEGVPAGLPISKKDIQKELEKRKGGTGRGERGKIETDEVKILSGVRFGKTIGSPIALLIENLDFENWKEEMNSEDVSCEFKNKIKVTKPRPGHADLSGIIKYGFTDVRNVLERASARETVARVAIGAVCKKLLLEFGVEIASHTLQISNIHATGGRRGISKRDFRKIKNVHKSDPLIRCLDKKTSQKMTQAISEAQKNKDTLGGVIEVIAHNVPVGLGSYVHFDRKLDGRLAQILMSIPSVKAVEIGNGIENAAKFGSEVHDEIYLGTDPMKGPSLAGGYKRKTNRAGGIEGGMSNGEDIILRVFFKPISTIGKPLRTVDIATKKETHAWIERSDICVVPRAGTVCENAVSFVLADAFLEKFAGDSIDQIWESFP